MWWLFVPKFGPTFLTSVVFFPAPWLSSASLFHNDLFGQNDFVCQSVRSKLLADPLARTCTPQNSTLCFQRWESNQIRAKILQLDLYTTQSLSWGFCWLFGRFFWNICEVNGAKWGEMVFKSGMKLLNIFANKTLGRKRCQSFWFRVKKMVCLWIRVWVGDWTSDEEKPWKRLFPLRLLRAAAGKAAFRTFTQL